MPINHLKTNIVEIPGLNLIPLPMNTIQKESVWSSALWTLRGGSQRDGSTYHAPVHPRNRTDPGLRNKGLAAAAGLSKGNQLDFLSPDHKGGK